MNEQQSAAGRPSHTFMAHHHKKKDLVEYARFYQSFLALHELYATGTTGKLLEQGLGVAINNL